MASVAPNDLSSLWMPFTDNRYFKANPRLMVAAQDMHYTTADGRRVLDGTAGLWCVNAGHGRETIVKAIQEKGLFTIDDVKKQTKADCCKANNRTYRKINTTSDDYKTNSEGKNAPLANSSL